MRECATYRLCVALPHRGSESYNSGEQSLS